MFQALSSPRTPRFILRASVFLGVAEVKSPCGTKQNVMLRGGNGVDSKWQLRGRS